MLNTTLARYLALLNKALSIRCVRWALDGCMLKEFSMSITTKAALMNCAETQMRSKGYSAFSYADLAVEVGIRKASIHHHFPTKE